MLYDKGKTKFDTMASMKVSLQLGLSDTEGQSVVKIMEENGRWMVMIEASSKVSIRSRQRPEGIVRVEENI